MDKNRGVAGFSIEIFMSHSEKKIRRGTLLCCVSEHFRLRKSLWIKRGGGSRISVEKILSNSAEKFRSGIPPSFINFGYRKNLDKRGGGIEIFRRKILVSQCRIFGRETLLCCVSEKFPLRKSLWIRAGEYHDFLSKNFCLTVPKFL